MRTKTLLPAVMLCLTSTAGVVHSADLVYEPINPAFGGDPFNGPFLLNSAEAQNKFKDPDRRRQDDDPSAQFVRALQSRLLNGLANQVAEAIFGENAQESGTITFDDQTITFERGLEGITVEIIDTSTGSSTVIEIPTLQLD
ncbi:MAG: curli assembly protein CsgF [Candidatus Competibacteraceae bacterium]